MIDFIFQYSMEEQDNDSTLTDASDAMDAIFVDKTHTKIVMISLHSNIFWNKILLLSILMNLMNYHQMTQMIHHQCHQIQQLVC